MRISWPIGATTYSYLKCIVYDKLLKPRLSFWITLHSLGHNNTLFLISRIQFDLFPILSKCACLCITVHCKCSAGSRTVKHFLRCSSMKTSVIDTDIKICHLFQLNWKHTLRHRQRATGMRGVGPHVLDIAMPQPIERGLYRLHKFALCLKGGSSECLRLFVCPFTAEANLSSNEFIWNKESGYPFALTL